MSFYLKLMCQYRLKLHLSHVVQNYSKAWMERQSFILSRFEYRTPLKPVLGGGGGGGGGGWRSWAVLHHYIRKHEQTQLKPVCYFRFLLPEDRLSELILLPLRFNLFNVRCCSIFKTF